MLERGRVVSPILEELYARLDEAEARRASRTRPFVTLAYAQSLDGSIAGAGKRPLSLSGASSLQLTHELRAAHGAILVGIGTVLSDDPQLNVRLVPGSDPQPIVVDSRLRLPDAAHLMANGRGTWLAVTAEAGEQDVKRARERGADVLQTPALDNGWVDLDALMASLRERELSHLLVEGGARILTSFIEARLVDYVVITVAPQFVGGVPVLCKNELSSFPRLASWRAERVGDDLVVAGEISWSDA
jgi:3,4-dihydroxy 2-butanone 4-phosphate synthase/GTP cyclohydrolase II